MFIFPLIIAGITHCVDVSLREFKDKFFPRCHFIEKIKNIFFLFDDFANEGNCIDIYGKKTESIIIFDLHTIMGIYS